MGFTYVSLEANMALGLEVTLLALLDLVCPGLHFGGDFLCNGMFDLLLTLHHVLDEFVLGARDAVFAPWTSNI